MTTIRGKLSMHAMFETVDFGLHLMLKRDDINGSHRTNLNYAAFANYSNHARVCGLDCDRSGGYMSLITARKSVDIDRFEKWVQKNAG